MTRCKYCRKDLNGPCATARDANTCENPPQDVRYTDVAPAHRGVSLKRWRGAFDIPSET